MTPWSRTSTSPRPSSTWPAWTRPPRCRPPRAAASSRSCAATMSTTGPTPSTTATGNTTTRSTTRRRITAYGRRTSSSSTTTAPASAYPVSSDNLFDPEWELYDLRTDPEELVNVADNPSYAEIRASLTDRLADLQNHYADDPLRRHGNPTPELVLGRRKVPPSPSPPTRRPSAQTPDALPPGSRGCGTFGPVGGWVMVVRSSTSLLGVDRKCRSVAVC